MEPTSTGHLILAHQASGSINLLKELIPQSAALHDFKTLNDLKSVLFKIVKHLMQAAYTVFPNPWISEIDLVEHLLNHPGNLVVVLKEVKQNCIFKQQQVWEAKQPFSMLDTAVPMAQNATLPSPNLAAPNPLLMNAQGLQLDLSRFLQTPNFLNSMPPLTPVLGPSSPFVMPNHLGGAQPVEQFKPLDLQQGPSTSTAPMALPPSTPVFAPPSTFVMPNLGFGAVPPSLAPIVEQFKPDLQQGSPTVPMAHVLPPPTPTFTPFTPLPMPNFAPLGAQPSHTSIVEQFKPNLDLQQGSSTAVPMAPLATPLSMQTLEQLLALSKNKYWPDIAQFFPSHEQNVPSTSGAPTLSIDLPAATSVLQQVSPPVSASDPSAFPFPPAAKCAPVSPPESRELSPQQEDLKKKRFLENLILDGISNQVPTTSETIAPEKGLTLDDLAEAAKYVAEIEEKCVKKEPAYKPPCSTASAMPFSLGTYRDSLRERNAPTYDDLVASTKMQDSEEESEDEEDVAQCDEQSSQVLVEGSSEIAQLDEQCSMEEAQESLEGDSETSGADEQSEQAAEPELAQEVSESLETSENLEPVTEQSEEAVKEPEETMESEPHTEAQQSSEELYIVNVADLYSEIDVFNSKDIETSAEAEETQDEEVETAAEDEETPVEPPKIEDDFSRFLDPNYFNNLETEVEQKCADAEKNGMVGFEVDQYFEELLEERMNDNFDYNGVTAFGQHNGIHGRPIYQPPTYLDSIKLARQLAHEDHQQEHPVRERARKRAGFFAEPVVEAKKPKKSRRSTKAQIQKEIKEEY